MDNITKDLIYIDGQEGFIDLEIVEDYEYYSNSPPDYTIRYESKHCESVEYCKGYNIYKSKKLPNIALINIKKIERNKIISLAITKSKLDKEYCNLINSYNIGIDMLNEKVIKAKKIKNSGYRKRSLKTLSYKIGLLLKSKRQQNGSIEYELLIGLLNKVPKKYISRYIQEIKFDERTMIKLNIIKINTIIIPYLEQQFQLKRIILSKEEVSLVEAFKETMKIKDEKITFDDYIDNWANKLLGKEKKVKPNSS